MPRTTLLSSSLASSASLRCASLRFQGAPGPVWHNFEEFIESGLKFKHSTLDYLTFAAKLRPSNSRHLLEAGKKERSLFRRGFIYASLELACHRRKMPALITALLAACVAGAFAAPLQMQFKSPGGLGSAKPSRLGDNVVLLSSFDGGSTQQQWSKMDDQQRCACRTSTEQKPGLVERTSEMREVHKKDTNINNLVG
jgi:hypothetical protein